MGLDEFLRLCSDAIGAKDSEALADAVGDFAQYCFANGAPNAIADDRLVHFLDATFRSGAFHGLTGAHGLLNIIAYDWASFTEPQRNILLDAIEFSFAKFQDWMAWFSLSAILGENYGDKAFATLMRLARVDKEGPRSMVPHGLEHVARGTSNEAIRSECINQIVRMQQDESPQVRDEALESLLRLRHLGVPGSEETELGQGDRAGTRQS